MADKQIALGSVIKLDDDGVAFDVVPLVITADPPPRSRERVDGKTLGDDFDVPLLGIENASEFKFLAHYDQGDTEHLKWTTLFDSGDDCDWQIITPHATPITKEFTGKIADLNEQQLANNTTIRAEITVIRTTDITVT